MGHHKEAHVGMEDFKVGKSNSAEAPKSEAAHSPEAAQSAFRLLTQQQDALKNRWSKVRHAGMSAWGELRQGTETAFTELKQGTESAYGELRSSLKRTVGHLQSAIRN